MSAKTATDRANQSHLCLSGLISKPVVMPFKRLP
jgi:hypothetical protein